MEYRERERTSSGQFSGGVSGDRRPPPPLRDPSLTHISSSTELAAVDAENAGSSKLFAYFGSSSSLKPTTQNSAQFTGATGQSPTPARRNGSSSRGGAGGATSPSAKPVVEVAPTPDTFTRTGHGTGSSVAATDSTLFPSAGKGIVLRRKPVVRTGREEQDSTRSNGHHDSENGGGGEHRKRSARVSKTKVVDPTDTTSGETPVSTRNPLSSSGTPTQTPKAQSGRHPKEPLPPPRLDLGKARHDNEFKEGRSDSFGFNGGRSEGALSTREGGGRAEYSRKPSFSSDALSSQREGGDQQTTTEAGPTDSPGTAREEGRLPTMMRSDTTLQTPTVTSTMIPTPKYERASSTPIGTSGSRNRLPGGVRNNDPGTFTPRSLTFQLVRKVGSGGFGTVSQAILRDGTLAAVKEMQLETSNLKAIDREVHAMANLPPHPNCVRYYGSRHSKHHYYIIMEYISGGSIQNLRHMVGRFRESVFQRYAYMVLLGLDHLHRHRIIHRDIKGANVLLDERGCAKIVDFGCCKDLNQVTSSVGGGGTPLWMAPEVCRGDPVTPKSDVWSFGCLCLEMTNDTGLPWSFPKGTSIAGLAYALASAQKPPEIPPHLTALAKDFIACCLRIDPEERLSVTELLDHPFFDQDYFGTTEDADDEFILSHEPSTIQSTRQSAVKRLVKNMGSTTNRRTDGTAEGHFAFNPLEGDGEDEVRTSKVYTERPTHMRGSRPRGTDDASQLTRTVNQGFHLDAIDDDDEASAVALRNHTTLPVPDADMEDRLEVTDLIQRVREGPSLTPVEQAEQDVRPSRPAYHRNGGRGAVTVSPSESSSTSESISSSSESDEDAEEADAKRGVRVKPDDGAAVHTPSTAAPPVVEDVEWVAEPLGPPPDSNVQAARRASRQQRSSPEKDRGSSYVVQKEQPKPRFPDGVEKAHPEEETVSNAVSNDNDVPRRERRRVTHRMRRHTSVTPPPGELVISGPSGEFNMGVPSIRQARHRRHRGQPTPSLGSTSTAVTPSPTTEALHSATPQRSHPSSGVAPTERTLTPSSQAPTQGPSGRTSPVPALTHSRKESVRSMGNVSASSNDHHEAAQRSSPQPPLTLSTPGSAPPPPPPTTEPPRVTTPLSRPPAVAPFRYSPRPHSTAKEAPLPAAAPRGLVWETEGKGSVPKDMSSAWREVQELMEWHRPTPTSPQRTPASRAGTPLSMDRSGDRQAAPTAASRQRSTSEVGAGATKRPSGLTRWFRGK